MYFAYCFFANYSEIIEL